MIRFFQLYRHYFFGFSMIGAAAFLIQEIPYMVMPLIQPESNPIMNMQSEIRWLEGLQSLFGVLSMVLLMLVVRDDRPPFPLASAKEICFFALAAAMIAINFIGWGFYYAGYQQGWLIVISQFAAVPLYYLFFGLWQGNFWLAAAAVPFFLIHTVNGYLNFIVQKG